MAVGRDEQAADEPYSVAEVLRVAGDVYAANDFVSRDKVIYGDEIGRDKIVNQGQLIINQARSAAEEAETARVVESSRLAQGVADYLARLLGASSGPAQACEGGPYRGLVAYGLSDAPLFFGREAAIAAIEGHLQRGKLTIIQSESGAGKTSLLQAGVGPRLLSGGHLPLILRPYDQSPSAAIKRAFLAEYEQLPTLAQAPLRAFLRQVAAMLGPDRILFIALDQFEEFFTLLPDAASRDPFIADLAECLDDPTLNVRWILALRSDFFGDLAAFRPRIRNPFENDFRLNRLTPQETRAIVVGPAAQCGLRFEERLVDALVADLTQPDGRIAPPQAQLVCLALSNAYADLKAARPDLPAELTFDLYQKEGAARGILRNHLNRVLIRAFPDTQQRDVARQVLAALISSEHRRIRRARGALAAQLAAAHLLPADLDKILDELVASRLINVEQEDTEQEATYELAHDYLLDEIRLAPELLAQKAAQELLDQEVEAHRRFGTLLSNDKFRIIDSQRPRLVVSDAAKQLLYETARRRRLARIRTVLLAALIPLVIFAAVGWRLYEQYRRQLPLRLLAEAQQARIALQPDRAIEKFRGAAQAAAQAEVTLPLDIPTAISDTLRHVATERTYQGEELVRIAQGQLGSERAKTLAQAGELFQNALALKPPPDTYMYILIPGGGFLMGASDAEVDLTLRLCASDELECAEDEFRWERPQHRVEARPFWITRTEITNEEYARCVRAGACEEPENARWKTQGYGREPVTNVDWMQARAYANWVGGRLPTEAEWEKACRGATGGLFPWGNSMPQAALLNYGPVGLNGPTVVGSFLPGAYGLYDMAGNIEEWTASLWGSDRESPAFRYPYVSGDGRENADAPDEVFRIVRGGAFGSSDLTGVRCVRRGKAPLGIRFENVGFRVALPAD